MQKKPPILSIADLVADPIEPADFPKGIIRYRNQAWAEAIGLDALTDEAWISHFARFDPLPGNLPQPLALRYHGHQFGTYNPELGDGRGFLYAQVPDAHGQWLDLGTKGSGQTPWSRQGDGRLTLKGAVREILASTQLESLGVSTSKTFSVIETGEELWRNDEPSPTRSAVMVRLQQSHIRFGSFQRLAYFEDTEGLARLLTHATEIYHPDALDEDVAIMAPAFLERVTEATGRMIGQWMAAGFVHGVMNTDNFNIAGETFDFGPYRFLPNSDPNFVAAYFDQTGLYRFGRQPGQGIWALQQLASSILPLSEAETLAESLGAYEPSYQRAFARHTLFLLGLQDGPNLKEDLLFLQTLYSWMTESEAAWSQVFFDWFGGSASADRAGQSPQASLYAQSAFAPVREALEERIPDRPERLQSAYFQKTEAESLLIDEIEEIWSAIAERDDWTLLSAKLDRFEAQRQALVATANPAA